MPSKKQLRSAKKLTNIKKQKGKYPELLDNIIESSDIVLEILDARFMEETRNLEIEKLIIKQKKQIIYVLNKSDLIDKAKTNQNLLKEIKPYIFVSATNRVGGKQLRDKIKELTKSIKPLDKQRFSIGVIGYPNTGKSSIINLLIGKKSAKTGSVAGFTKGLQKLKLTRDIVLIDSPGVIPREEYSNTDVSKIIHHTMVGARDSNKVKDPELIIAQLAKTYQKQFEEFYNVEITDSEDLIEQVGRNKNILKKGGEVNGDQVARKIIKDWQEGKIKL
jgi:ribosome biogenesis GTPase A